MYITYHRFLSENSNLLLFPYYYIPKKPSWVVPVKTHRVRHFCLCWYQTRRQRKFNRCPPSPCFCPSCPVVATTWTVHFSKTVLGSDSNLFSYSFVLTFAGYHLVILDKTNTRHGTKLKVLVIRSLPQDSRYVGRTITLSTKYRCQCFMEQTQYWLYTNRLLGLEDKLRFTERDFFVHKESSFKCTIDRWAKRQVII